MSTIMLRVCFVASFFSNNFFGHAVPHIYKSHIKD